MSGRDVTNDSHPKEGPTPYSMSELKEDLSLKLFVVLSKAYHSVVDDVQEDIRQYGLNPTEFAVLELLLHKGEQPMQQIGEKILLASGSITYVADKLELKGLMKRKPCPEDRRVTFAALTEQGEQLMKRIFPAHRTAIQRITGGLDADEQRQLIALLKKLGYSAKAR